MGYELAGRAHAAMAAVLERAAREGRGQGTVEYVGLVLLISVVIAAVVAAGGDAKDAGITDVIIDKLKGAIDSVEAKGG